MSTKKKNPGKPVKKQKYHWTMQRVVIAVIALLLVIMLLVALVAQALPLLFT